MTWQHESSSQKVPSICWAPECPTSRRSSVPRVLLRRPAICEIAVFDVNVWERAVRVNIQVGDLVKWSRPESRSSSDALTVQVCGCCSHAGVIGDRFENEMQQWRRFLLWQRRSMTVRHIQVLRSRSVIPGTNFPSRASLQYRSLLFLMLRSST